MQDARWNYFKFILLGKGGLKICLPPSANFEDLRFIWGKFHADLSLPPSFLLSLSLSGPRHLHQIFFRACLIRADCENTFPFMRPTRAENNLKLEADCSINFALGRIPNLSLLTTSVPRRSSHCMPGQPISLQRLLIFFEKNS